MLQVLQNFCYKSLERERTLQNYPLQNYLLNLPYLDLVSFFVMLTN